MRPLLLLAVITLVALAATLLTAPRGANEATDPLLTAANSGGTAIASEAAAGAPVSAGGGVVPAPQVRTNVDVRPYTVTGEDEQTILRSLISAAPISGEETFFGLTTSDLTFKYWRQPDANGCQLIGLQVELGVTIDIPTWEPHPAASYELKRDWDRFSNALKRHEERHRDLAVEGAHDVLQALQGIRAATCDLAVAEAQQRAQRFQIETEAAHRQYDEQTRHGETEGAVWPLR